MTKDRISYWRQRAEEQANGPYDYGGGMELLRILDEREALLNALRAVEWGGDSFQGFAAVCPECVASEGKPHEPDCALATALAKAEAP